MLFLCFIILITCNNPFDEPCDDCMHFAMEIGIINSIDSSKILNIKEILLDQNGTRQVLNTGDLFYGANMDSVYRVSALTGKYNVNIINFNNDTICLQNISINRNKCNVLTKNISLFVDSTWISLHKSLKNFTKAKPLNTVIKEDYHCG